VTFLHVDDDRPRCLRQAQKMDLRTCRVNS
jgi:hypothetical protein